MIEVSDDTNLADKYEKLSVVLNTLVDHAIPVNKKTGTKDGTLKADCIEHFMMFRAKFSKVIGQVDKANNIDSFPQFVHYIFNQRESLTGGLLDNLTMQTLTQNSSQIRNFGWYVANICTLYNEFVKVKKLKKGDQNKDTHDSMVISTGLVSWKDFKDEIPFSLQKAVEGQLSDIYSNR